MSTRSWKMLKPIEFSLLITRRLIIRWYIREIPVISQRISILLKFFCIQRRYGCYKEGLNIGRISIPSMNFHFHILESRIPLFFKPFEPYKFVDVLTIERRVIACVHLNRPCHEVEASCILIDERIDRTKAERSRWASTNQPKSSSLRSSTPTLQLSPFRRDRFLEFSSYTLSKHLLEHHPVQINSLSFARNENI